MNRAQVDRRSSIDESWAELVRGVARDFRRTWPQLLVTDVLATAVGFAVLAPLTAVLLRVLVGGGESAVLTDEDILLFLLGPAGIVALVLAGAFRLGVTFAEVAGLVTIGFGAVRDRRVSWIGALWHAARRAPVLARLAGQMVMRALLVAAPLLALAALVYARLLTEHDINYYLDARPRELWIAAAVVGALLLVLAACLLLLALRWCLAIPMVLFERRGPREALRASAEATRGRRRSLALWLSGWLVVSAMSSTVGAVLIGFAHRVFVPTEGSSLTLLAAAVGVALLLIALIDELVSFFTSSLLALLAVRLYVRCAGPGELEGREIGVVGSLGTRAEWSVPRQGLLWGGLAAIALAAAFVFTLVETIRVERYVNVAAHRGGAAGAPENTLAAIEHAIAAGADQVEIDVQESADGVVVVLHDQDFLRVGKDARKIWELRSDELLAIDIGSSFASEFAAQRAPTLAQVLALCKGRIGVIIELKYYGHDERLEERVVELVEAQAMADEVEIMSLTAAGLQKARALRPDWTYGLLVAVAIGDLARLDYDFIAVRASLADHGLIRRAHRRAHRVYAWTVDEPAQMSALISRGVDVLITDEPALARSVVAQHAELSLVERLLVAVGVRFGLLDDEDDEDDEERTAEDA